MCHNVLRPPAESRVTAISSPYRGSAAALSAPGRTSLGPQITHRGCASDHRLGRDRKPARDLGTRHTVGRLQHDPRPRHQPGFGRRAPQPFLEDYALTVRKDQWRCTHTQFNQTTPPNYSRSAALGATVCTPIAAPVMADIGRRATD